MYTITF